MQVDHQQSPLPGRPQPLAKHARAHAQNAEDQDSGHDDLSTTPMETKPSPEVVQTARDYPSHLQLSF
jgi:hypothetical protein